MNKRCSSGKCRLQRARGEPTIDLNFGQTSWRAGNVQGKSKKQKTENRRKIDEQNETKIICKKIRKMQLDCELSAQD